MRLRNTLRAARINAASLASNFLINPASCCSLVAPAFLASFLAFFMTAQPPLDATLAVSIAHRACAIVRVRDAASHNRARERHSANAPVRLSPPIFSNYLLSFLVSELPMQLAGIVKY